MQGGRDESWRGSRWLMRAVVLGGLAGVVGVAGWGFLHWGGRGGRGDDGREPVGAGQAGLDGTDPAGRLREARRLLVGAIGGGTPVNWPGGEMLACLALLRSGSVEADLLGEIRRRLRARMRSDGALAGADSRFSAYETALGLLVVDALPAGDRSEALQAVRGAVLYLRRSVHGMDGAIGEEHAWYGGAHNGLLNGVLQRGSAEPDLHTTLHVALALSRVDPDLFASMRGAFGRFAQRCRVDPGGNDQRWSALSPAGLRGLFVRSSSGPGRGGPGAGEAGGAARVAGVHSVAGSHLLVLCGLGGELRQGLDRLGWMGTARQEPVFAGGGPGGVLERRSVYFHWQRAMLLDRLVREGWESEQWLSRAGRLAAVLEVVGGADRAAGRDWGNVHEPGREGDSVTNAAMVLLVGLGEG